MSCPEPTQWDALSMGVLDEHEAAALQRHARRCPSCRERCEDARREHLDLVRLHGDFGIRHDESREHLMAMLSQEHANASFAGAPAGLAWLGDRIVNLLQQPTTRWAAVVLAPAACVAVVVLLTWGTAAPNAFAAVLQRFREAQTITCRVTVDMTATMRHPDGSVAQTVEQQRNERLHISAVDGTRRDAYENDELISTTFDPHDGAVLVLDHRQRRYYDFGAVEPSEEAQELEDSLRDLAAERPLPELHFFGISHDPDRLIEGLRRLTTAADRDLGIADIDGREAVGFEIAGDKIGFAPPVADTAADNRAELWVDAATRLPVRLTLRFATRIERMRDLPLSASFEMSATYDHFEFDLHLPEDMFDATIPEGFEPADDLEPGLAEVPTEADLITAFEAFAEHAGRFPAALQPTNMTFEVSYLMGALQARRLTAERSGESVEDLPEPADIGPQFSGFIYYMVLVSERRNPQYFGATVQPGDADSVLMQWTLEDGRTRVLYGDLTAETLR